MILVTLRTRPWQGFPASHNPQRAFVENRHPGVLGKEAPFAFQRALSETKITANPSGCLLVRMKHLFRFAFKVIGDAVVIRAAIVASSGKKLLRVRLPLDLATLLLGETCQMQYDGLATSYGINSCR